MPSVSTITDRTHQVVKLSQKFFQPSLEELYIPPIMLGQIQRQNFARENPANVDTSLITAGQLKTNSNFVKSDYAGRPSITNLINSYRELRENFAETLRENMKALREASEQLKESKKDAEAEEAEKTKSQDDDNKNEPRNVNEEPHTGLSMLNEFSAGNIPPVEQNIANTNATQIAEGITERRDAQTASVQNAANNRQLAQANLAPKTANERIREFAQNYLTPEDETPKGSAIVRIDEEDKLGMLEGLVREYNSALSYLNENRDMSNKLSALASRFGNNEDLAEALSAIGISVNENGVLSINEQKLSAALDRNSEGVNEILGDRGLAGRLERNVNLADRQGANLFPTISEYLEEQEEEREDEAESLYSLGNFGTAMYSRNNNRMISVFT